MITKEQVADLHEGDVVELGFSSGAIVRGPLVEDRHTGGLDIADAGWSVRQGDGGLPYGLERIAETLTVVSRAPRPLYVNHDRTAAVKGDVARDSQSHDGERTWVFDGARWHWTRHPDEVAGDLKRVTLRLLVDGETGQVVP